MGFTDIHTHVNEWERIHEWEKHQKDLNSSPKNYSIDVK